LNRVPYFPIMKDDNARQGFFEKTEFESLVANLLEPVADAATFGYHSGWRRAEIVTFRWDAVDRPGKVRLRDTKGGKPRSLPLDGELLQLIERRWKAREYKTRDGVTAVSDLVFHRNGKQLRDFRKSWSAACRIAGVPGRKFHDLHRTAVRNLTRAGVAQAVAMSITGHETDSVFRRYDIVSQEDKLEGLRRTRAHLSGYASEGNIRTFTGRGQHGQNTDNQRSKG
jgi:integrase